MTEAVLEYAQRWHEAGALVIVSEAEPLPLPGWGHRQIAGPSNAGAPFRSKSPEWLTISPERAP